ncbi:hypothetical protein T4A_1277 [Trichinella pseudospiralis]|uniref:Uncharacterized protein n=1 Tax=Trichinella pseudospiralis TaxID=6337 RepID=A0A0V1ERR2_TRIPS|nr:hypothetical protein T4A_1277 [Trichinella pseudospiralis]
MTSNRISRQVCHLEPFGKYIPPRLHVETASEKPLFFFIAILFVDILFPKSETLKWECQSFNEIIQLCSLDLLLQMLYILSFFTNYYIQTAAISDRVLASEHRRTSTSSVLCAASAELSSSVIDALLNFYASGNDRSDAFGFVPRRSSKRVVVFCHHPVVAIRNGGVGYVEIDFIRQRKKEIIVICENS